MLFGLFIVIAFSAGLVFNVLTIALPKIVDEGMATSCRWLLVGSIATAVLVCGAIAQLAVGRAGRMGSAARHICRGDRASALPAICGRPTQRRFALIDCAGDRHRGDLRAGHCQRHDLARYTADAWRGRVYAVRYFLLFISAGAAIGMISLLHESGGFAWCSASMPSSRLIMFLSHAGSGGADHQRRRQA